MIKVGEEAFPARHKSYDSTDPISVSVLSSEAEASILSLILKLTYVRTAFFSTGHYQKSHRLDVLRCALGHEQMRLTGRREGRVSLAALSRRLRLYIVEFALTFIAKFS